MWNIFKKDPISELENKYYEKLAEARQHQSSEDVGIFMSIMYEANKLYTKIENLRYNRQKTLQHYRLQ